MMSRMTRASLFALSLRPNPNPNPNPNPRSIIPAFRQPRSYFSSDSQTPPPPPDQGAPPSSDSPPGGTDAPKVPNIIETPGDGPPDIDAMNRFLASNPRTRHIRIERCYGALF